MTQTEWPKRQWHIFVVFSNQLSDFVEKAQQDDQLGGNNIEMMDKTGNGKYIVAITRQYPYPFVIDRLREEFG